MEKDYQIAKQRFIEDMQRTYDNQKSRIWKLLMGKFEMDRNEESLFKAGYYWGKMVANKEYDEWLKHLMKKLKQ